MKNYKTKPVHSMLTGFMFAVFAFVPAIYGQTGDANINQETAAGSPAKVLPAAAPAMTEFNGVKIGMTADEAIQKLGKPEASDAAGMYFELPNGGAMQLALDGEKKITTLSMIYTGKKADAPEFAEVFGTDVKPDTQDNGSVFKRIRYSDLGIWVSYSLIGDKDSPMTTVTVQKIKQ